MPGDLFSLILIAILAFVPFVLYELWAIKTAHTTISEYMALGLRRYPGWFMLAGLIIGGLVGHFWFWQCP